MNEPRLTDDDFDVAAELRELGMSLEELEQAEADLPDAVAPLLETVLEPSPGYQRRVVSRAERRLRDSESLREFGALFGLGIQTARLIIEGDDDARRR